MHISIGDVSFVIGTSHSELRHVNAPVNDLASRRTPEVVCDTRHRGAARALLLSDGVGKADVPTRAPNRAAF